MSRQYPEVKHKLMERGKPSILFQLENVRAGLSSVTVTNVGELLFTTTAVCFRVRASYTNLWRLWRFNPIAGLSLFLPGLLIVSVLFGVIGVSIGGRGEEAWNVGAAVGAVLSIPLTIWGVSRRNKRSYARAAAKLQNPDPFNPEAEFDQIMLFYWRDEKLTLEYDPALSKLVICGEWGFDVPVSEWQRHFQQIDDYRRSTRRSA